MSDNIDNRTKAAERLQHLLHLGHRARRRRGRGEPWNDPRTGQGRVLALLKLKPEITQRELCFLLGVSKQSLAELLSKLERRGFVTREPSAEDRRVTLVRLTEAGAAEQQSRVVDPQIANLLETLDDDEVARFSDYLERLIEALEQQLDQEVPGESPAEGDHNGHRGPGFHGHGHGHGRGPGQRHGHGRGQGRDGRGERFEG